MKLQWYQWLIVGCVAFRPGDGGSRAEIFRHGTAPRLPDRERPVSRSRLSVMEHYDFGDRFPRIIEAVKAYRDLLHRW